MSCHRLLYQGWFKLFWSKSKTHSFQEVDLEDHSRPQAEFCAFELGPLDGDNGQHVGSDPEDIEDDAGPAPLEDDAEPSFNLTTFLSSCPTDDKDIFVQPERVRAKRAGEWICDPVAFMERLWIAIATTGGTVRMLYFLMREQKEATWSGTRGLDKVPLVQCATFSRSNIVFCLDTYAAVMDGKPEDWFWLLHGSLALQVKMW